MRSHRLFAEQFDDVRRAGRGWSGFGSRPGWGGPFGGGPGGPPPWVAAMFGHGPWSGFGQQRRGPRVRRGDVRGAILDVLSHEPLNGYQIIQKITEKSGGSWRPSPGSVYPTIAQLEDEGLVESFLDAGKKVLRLTDEGRSYIAKHPDEMASIWTPFEERDDEGDVANLKPLIGQMMSGIWQIAVSGSPDQQAEAARILADTRRRLYGILADGPETDNDRVADADGGDR
jgi:DNA-binding PadR family transcriptional regulator